MKYFVVFKHSWSLAFIQESYTFKCNKLCRREISSFMFFILTPKDRGKNLHPGAWPLKLGWNFFGVLELLNLLHNLYEELLLKSLVKHQIVLIWRDILTNHLGKVLSGLHPVITFDWKCDASALLQVRGVVWFMVYVFVFAYSYS